MSSKLSNTASKSTCERYVSHNFRYNCRNNKSAGRVVVPKKILISKNLAGPSDDCKSSSAGVISHAATKVRKAAKSDLNFNKKATKKVSPLDLCKKCGDSLQNRNEIKSELSRHQVNTLSTTSSKSNNRNNTNCVRNKSVQQYYMNENFGLSTESIHETENIIRKTSLDTIKELPEARTISDNTIFRINSDSESESGFLDVDDDDAIKSLKEFRNKNYFECHSAKSKIKNAGSVTGLGNHECVYRFYLNDRLFPVPLNTDYNNQIRCVECHLPMQMKLRDSNKINGTIQAKVKLGDEIKDTMLLLPAKEPLIIKEKRREERSNCEEVYFGVIKLDINGNSKFGSTQPNNSLALKYQKGYKEYFDRYDGVYKRMDKDDVIIL